MSFDFRQSGRVGIALILAGLFAVPGNLLAEASLHVASPSELQAATIQASRVRQQNLETVRNFISSNQARQALRSAHLNPQQVKEAVSSLNDSELLGWHHADSHLARAFQLHPIDGHIAPAR